jgi:thiamine-phosphate pyrophosphorylase
VAFETQIEPCSAFAILGQKTATALLLLYYITDRSKFPGSELERRDLLLRKISEAASAGIDYIQLREKDLPARELETLSRQSAQIIHQASSSTRLLINSRTDVAIAAGAHGVHLTSTDISPIDVRKIWRGAEASEPIIAVSCHSEADVIAAESASDRVAAGVRARPGSAEFVVFSPVFDKQGSTAAGLDQLRKVCQYRIPVLALGGVTAENAHLCIEAGASGIAGIRLFQENEIAAVVTKLRGSK